MPKIAMPRYPEEFQVMQLTGENAEELAGWTGVGTIDAIANHATGIQQTIKLSTPRGQLTVLRSDYVVKCGGLLAIIPEAAMEGSFVMVDPEDVDDRRPVEPAPEETEEERIAREMEEIKMKEQAESKAAGKEQQDASQEGQQPEGDQQQHSNGDSGGQAAETGGGDSLQQSGEEQPKTE